MKFDIMVNSEIYSLNKISTGNAGPVVLFVTMDSESNDSEQIYRMVKNKINKPFVFYELIVKDWDTYLTPWPMTMGKREFKGKADYLLDVINTDIINEIQRQVGKNSDIFIVGYSLAGLFSVYTVYNSEIFAGLASCSGSLWYKGFTEYTQTKKLKRKIKVYLSLGNKEKNSKNEYMKTVEEATLIQRNIFEQSDFVTECNYELNEGGHFSNVPDRVVKGICYLLSNCE